MTIMNKTARATIHRLCFHLSVKRAAKKNKNDEYKPVAKGDEIINGTKKFQLDVPAEYQYFVLGRITGNYNWQILIYLIE